MTTFVALYRGQTVASAQLIAVSADPALIALVSRRLLERGEQVEDPVLKQLATGRRAAIRTIQHEAEAEAEGEDDG